MQKLRPESRRVFWLVLLMIIALVLVALLAYQAYEYQRANAEPIERDQPSAELAKGFSAGVTDEQRRAALIDLFAAGGAGIKVLRFSCEELEEDGGRVRRYEAEVEFLNQCLLKESRAAHWWPDDHPVGLKSAKPSPTLFMEGQRWLVRGIIDLDGPGKHPHAPRK